MAAAAVCFAIASFVMPLLYLLYDNALFVWRSGEFFFDLADTVLALIAGATVAAVYGALPAVPLIVLSELTRERGWPNFIVGGALVGILIFAEMLVYPTMQRLPGLDMLGFLIVGGSLCGIVYRLTLTRLLPISG
ncbi:hypothetical protein FJ987_24150 [Mesorhizobium sp. CU2]|uniref:hypothetical protein n=1 Tax=unclassified Mesorhizobium TaxID=325217 RepID=UPI00112AA8C0|nr:MULTISPECIES: hypothetical protein [unclassified Mesorhizobium]TPN83684.1 hypothetical protein FJ988_12930 [Mesorhizobium sp. CU3]TPO07568.1 hypothetical protein FJ987_24150 [Mesorhizobium sp. CU2]